MPSETQKKIEAARKRYDDLAAKTAKAAKEDKTIRATLEAEVKQKLKGRPGDRDKLIKEKGDAHRELVALMQQREGEIVAAVSDGDVGKADAKEELMSLGHTADSADIQIRRALKQPAATEAPSPPSAIVEAPLPPKEAVPEPAPQGDPLKVDDPISDKVPESQTVTYRDPAPDDKK